METVDAVAQVGAVQLTRVNGQPMLIVLCGPSHAGKSTFANQRCKGFKVVSADRIRGTHGRSLGSPRDEAKVWQRFEAQQRAALTGGYDVVRDACHISGAARWHALQGPTTRHRKICVVFDVPLECVQQRGRETGRLSCKDVERVWQDFQRQKPSESQLLQGGFDEVHFIRE